MSINIFSILLICYLFYIMIKEKNIHKIFVHIVGLSISVRLFVRMGYFINIGNSYITYTSFLSYLLLLFILVYLLTEKIKITKGNVCFLVFVLIILVCFTLRVFVPYEEVIIFGNWGRYVSTVTNYVKYEYSSFAGSIAEKSVQIGNYLVILVSVGLLLITKNKFKKDDYTTIANIGVIFSKVEIMIGIFEAIFKNIFKSNIITDLCINVFGVYGWQHSELDKRGTFYELVGTTKEASFLSTTLFYALILLIIVNRKTNSNSSKIWIIMGLLLLFINPSMSSYVYIFLVLVIYAVLFREHKTKALTYTSVIGLAVVSLFSFLLSRIQELLSSDLYILNRVGLAIDKLSEVFQNGSSLSYTSESIRFGGINNAISLIPHRPLFGFGIGDVNCDSGLFSLVTNIGIIGSLFWVICVYFYFCDNSLKRSNCLLFVILLLIVPNVFLNDFDVMTMLVVPVWGQLAMIYTDCFSTRIRPKVNYSKRQNKLLYVIPSKVRNL